MPPCNNNVVAKSHVSRPQLPDRCLVDTSANACLYGKENGSCCRCVVNYKLKVLYLVYFTVPLIARYKNTTRPSAWTQNSAKNGTVKMTVWRHRFYRCTCWNSGLSRWAALSRGGAASAPWAQEQFQSTRHTISTHHQHYRLPSRREVVVVSVEEPGNTRRSAKIERRILDPNSRHVTCIYY